MSSDSARSQNKKWSHDHIKSYVVRAGRITKAQAEALEILGPKYLIDASKERFINFEECFGRKAPMVVEIGFGMGRSFIEMAESNPNCNYLGIEVHPPGVGAAMMLAENRGVANVRIIKYDAFVVLNSCMTENSIDVLQIFFPDPWPKARHHKRRLVNQSFINMVKPLLKQGAQIRLATDFQEYAEQMLDLLTKTEGFTNLDPQGGFMPRPSWRPLTKFELRGEGLGHKVFDIVFRRD